MSDTTWLKPYLKTQMMGAEDQADCRECGCFPPSYNTPEQIEFWRGRASAFETVLEEIELRTGDLVGEITQHQKWPTGLYVVPDAEECFDCCELLRYCACYKDCPHCFELRADGDCPICLAEYPYCDLCSDCCRAKFTTE